MENSFPKNQQQKKRAVIWCAVSSQAQTAEDKISLPEQERAARAWCEKNDYEVVTVLKVDGYSRSETDLIVALEEFRRQGVTAYDDVRTMWMTKSFDMLVTYTHSRLGRSFALSTHIISNVIRSGAQIYLLDGGLIHEDNQHMFMALGGASSASEVSRLVKARKAAMTARAQRGLPTSSGIIISHRVVRDEYGKGKHIEVDESKRRLWDDVALLVIEGIGWKEMEAELYARFGHVDESGEPFKRLNMYHYLHHPTFWGNSARYFTTGENGTKTDMWVFDPDVPAPKGVEIYYNTHEPVYKGELAEKVKAELRRRRLSIRGTNRPARSHAFSGLFVCAKCGYNLVYKGNKGYPSYGCNSRHWQNEQRTDCDQRKSLPAWKIQKWLDTRLNEMMAIGEPTIFMADTSHELEFYNRRISDLRKEILGLDDKIRRIISAQATVESDVARNIYAEEIEKYGKQLQKMRESLAQLERAKPSSNVLEGQLKAFKEIQEMSLDSFWELPEVEMNQLLHRVFGTRRLAVRDGGIVGVVEG